jgi:hypothetical protein
LALARTSVSLARDVLLFMANTSCRSLCLGSYDRNSERSPPAQACFFYDEAITWCDAFLSLTVHKHNGHAHTSESHRVGKAPAVWRTRLQCLGSSVRLKCLAGVLLSSHLLAHMHLRPIAYSSVQPSHHLVHSSCSNRNFWCCWAGTCVQR